jgi:CHAT domain-containing protein/tetratricopeptide (TPR) repeat protein
MLRGETIRASPPGRPKRHRASRWHVLVLCASVALPTLVLIRVVRDGDRSRGIVRETVHFPAAEAAREGGDFDAAIAAYTRSIAAEPHDPRSYFGLVDSHSRRGDLDAAEAALRALLAADPGNACVRYGLGGLAVKRQDLEGALAEARAAIDLDPDLGHAWLLLGTVHYYSGRASDAIAAWRRARRVFHRAGDREYEAWALNRTALVRRELGLFREALVEFDDALAIQSARGDRRAQQLTLGNAGLTRADLGDLAGATASFHRALALAREVSDREGECWNLTNLAHVLNQAGEHHRAIECADSAVGLARDLREPMDEISGLLCRAAASTNLGDPLAALAASKRAALLADSLVDPRHRTGALLAMARAYLALGRLPRARDCFARCDSTFRRIGVEASAWEAQIGLCETAFRGGDTTQAIGFAERTLEASVRAGYAEFEESLTRMLSDWSLARGDIDPALALATRAVELSRRDGRRNREALALARRAEILLARGEVDRARADARAARGIAVAIRNPEVLWECEMAEGDARRDSDPEAALLHYEAAMAAVEAIHRTLGLEEYRAAYLERTAGLYYKAADLLVSLRRDDEALGACERSRARAFRDLLAASPARIAPSVPESLAARNRALEGSIRTLEATRGRLAAATGTDAHRLREVDRELAFAKQEWDDVRAEIQLLDPRYGALAGRASRPDVRAIVGAVGRGQALVEYALGPHGSLCFVVTNGEVRAVRLPVSCRRLSGEIDSLLQPLMAPLSLGTLHFDLALAERLREQIFDPVAPLVRDAARLIVVPDGPLHFLPFEALVVDRGGTASDGPLYGAFARTRFLDERFAIEYLPSSSLLVWPSRPESPGPPGSLLAIGGPDGAEMVSGDGEGTMNVGASAPAGAPSTPAGAPPARSRLLRSEEEVQAIASRFPDASVWVGANASEATFKALAPRFRLLHLSAHGVLDEAVPLYSGLRLAVDPGGREDGFVHAYEILELPLQCELVALSACESGRGRLYAAEGLVGLTRSFLYAGAQRALVSLWSVNDTSTAILMDRFYANLASGLDACAALRDAKRALRERVAGAPDGDRVSYAHPFFWAPFILIGTGSAR